MGDCLRVEKNALRQRRFRRIRGALTAASIGLTATVATTSVAYGGTAIPDAAAGATQAVLGGAPAPAAAGKRAPRSFFRVATLNVLGSQHTRGRGGFASGRKRAGGEAELIRSRGINLVGMSEVQPDQYDALAHDLPRYTVWPQGALGRNGYRLQFAWRTSRFKKIDSGSTTYVFAHQYIPLPYVRLRDRQSGASFWVISTHNSPRGMQRERVSATRTETRVVRHLRRQGHPVLLVGDLNEHARGYCRIAAHTRMVSANGGYFKRFCHPPWPSEIDWIMGTRNVGFSDYVRDTTTRSRGLSDHPLYYADAEIAD
jgi:endonuclease/exonuclease/phosphatase family metal-dependent hydrolase